MLYKLWYVQKYFDEKSVFFFILLIFLLGKWRRRLQLVEHSPSLQLLDRLPEKRVQDEGAQNVHRLPANTQLQQYPGVSKIQAF